MDLFFKKGQSIIEYALLLAIILAALVIMQIVIKRAYQGRIKQEADSIGQQYSPLHTTGNFTVNTTTNTTTLTGGSYNQQSLEGLTLTFTNTTTNTTKGERVDAFTTED
jgi:uncharacterized protein (UPF0333 family)